MLKTKIKKGVVLSIPPETWNWYVEHAKKVGISPEDYMEMVLSLTKFFAPLVVGVLTEISSKTKST